MKLQTHRLQKRDTGQTVYLQKEHIRLVDFKSVTDENNVCYRAGVAIGDN